MSLVELKIDRIQYSETQTGAYVLFLSEPVTHKKLPIVIGGLEAHAITIGLEKDLIPQRPLTHDLMKSVMENYGIRLKKVIINKFDQGIFYALLITEKDGIEKAIDSRTSDAVAMAVRFDAPIYCESEVLEEAGIYLPSENISENVDHKASEQTKEEDFDFDLDNLLKEIDDMTQPISDLEENEANQNLSEYDKLVLNIFGESPLPYTKKEIEKMLEAAIEEEQYERAAQLKKLLDLMP
jgi:bifunctional DNase/RNase